MKTKLINIWNSYRSSYWFVPTVMTAIAIMVAAGVTAIDVVLPAETIMRLGWLYKGGAEGARSLLATVAASMITIAGVVFSITVVVLSLTTTQFGPRLLSKFMRDTGTQVVFGTFISTFIYCLFVLRVIRDDSNGPFIPHVSVTFAFFLALAGTAVLIYFIHHIAASIQADSIISTVYRDLAATIDRLMPENVEEIGKDTEGKDVTTPLPDNFEQNAVPVKAGKSGYIQAIDLGGLKKMAEKNDLILRLHFRPGEFIAEGTPLVSAWPAADWDEELAEETDESFILGKQRTEEQDIEYALKQLVEIALRALSPGINDPFTAITCIDWLYAAIGRIMRKRFPSHLIFDDKEKLRLVLVPLDFEEVVEAAFGQLRHAAARHLQVILRILAGVAALAPHVRTDEQFRVLENHAALTARTGSEEALVADDRRIIDERMKQVLQALGR